MAKHYGHYSESTNDKENLDEESDALDFDFNELSLEYHDLTYFTEPQLQSTAPPSPVTTFPHRYPQPDAYFANTTLQGLVFHKNNEESNLSLATEQQADETIEREDDLSGPTADIAATKADSYCISSSSDNSVIADNQQAGSTILQLGNTNSHKGKTRRASSSKSTLGNMARKSTTGRGRARKSVNASQASDGLGHGLDDHSLAAPLSHEQTVEEPSSPEKKGKSQDAPTSSLKTPSSSKDKKIKEEPISTPANSGISTEGLTISASGRAQRVRKKPKRWENDDVQADFTGQSYKYAVKAAKSAAAAAAAAPIKEAEPSSKTKEPNVTEQQQQQQQPPTKKRRRTGIKATPKSVTKVVTIVKNDPPENKEEMSDNSEEDDEEEEEEEDLTPMCFCREPFQKRFMIECDCCNQWYHGSCVGITPVMGDEIEDSGDPWHCVLCKEWFAKGVKPKEAKRLVAEKFAEWKDKESREPGAPQPKQKQQAESSKVSQKPKLLKSNTSKRKRAEDSDLSMPSDDGESDVDMRKAKSTSTKAMASKKESKDDEQQRKLKKLIKEKKKDLNEKLTKKQESRPLSGGESTAQLDQPFSETTDQASTSSSVTSSVAISSSSPKLSSTSSASLSPNGVTKAASISKGKDETAVKKKKIKIDHLRQDLVEIEPALKAQSSSSVSAAAAASVLTTTNKSPSKQSSTSLDQRKPDSMLRKGLAPSTERQPKGRQIGCPGCSATHLRNADSETIFCKQSCIEEHVSEMLKQLRVHKKYKEKDNPVEAQKPLKATLKNPLNDHVLVGKEALLEKDVLSFILKNPVYQVLEPSKAGMARHAAFKVQTNQSSPVKDNKPHQSSGHRDSTSVKATSSNDKHDNLKKTAKESNASSHKLERSPSVSAKSESEQRQWMRRQLREIFEARFKELSDKDKSRVGTMKDLNKLASKIDEELHSNLEKSHNSQKYLTKSRSLVFNLKDQKNNLCRKVMTGKISPGRLVNMSSDELASNELKNWRESEKKASLELIKRDAVDQASQVVVKKTHKGEEIIAAKKDLISALPLAGVTTSAAKTGSPSKSVSAKSAAESSVAAKVAPASSPQVEVQNGVLNILDDTTCQHNEHVFSNTCRICSGFEDSPNEDNPSPAASSTSQSTKNTLETKSTGPSTSNSSGPKRVRVEPESTSKLLEQAAKLNEQLFKGSNGEVGGNLKLPFPPRSGTTSSIDSTLAMMSKKSHKIAAEQQHLANGLQPPVWQGNVFMKTIANFIATAHIISGKLDGDLRDEIGDRVEILGRFSNEQMNSQISKLDLNSRRGAVILQFDYPTREDRTGYDAFFFYLVQRKRNAIGSIKGSTFEDFYILPYGYNESKSEILRSITPGLEIKRRFKDQNLLIGLLIRNNGQSGPLNIPLTPVGNHESSSSLARANLASLTPPRRSFTPPLSANVDNSSLPAVLFEGDDDGSYTPPPPSRPSSSKKRPNDHSGKSSYEMASSKVMKYDPEKVKSKPKSSATTTLAQSLISGDAASLEKYLNPSELSRLQEALMNPDTPESGRCISQILGRLNDDVENQRRAFQQQTNETVDRIAAVARGNAPAISALGQAAILAGSNGDTESIVRWLNSVMGDINKIEIPPNLRDILANPMINTVEDGDGKAPIVTATATATATASATVTSETNELNRSANLTRQGTFTEGVSGEHTNREARNDPRLARTKVQQQPQPSTMPQSELVPIAGQVATLSQEELLRMAQEQMNALSQMESSQQQSLDVSPLQQMNVPPPLLPHQSATQQFPGFSYSVPPPPLPSAFAGSQLPAQLVSPPQRPSFNAANSGHLNPPAASSAATSSSMYFSRHQMRPIQPAREEERQEEANDNHSNQKVSFKWKRKR